LRPGPDSTEHEGEERACCDTHDRGPPHPRMIRTTPRSVSSRPRSALVTRTDRLLRKVRPPLGDGRAARRSPTDGGRIQRSRLRRHHTGPAACGLRRSS
jgi:hypothetical protein